MSDSLSGGDPGLGCREDVKALQRNAQSDLRSEFVTADLGDATGLEAAVREVAPDFVIHTAGKTPPATDDELFQANFWSTIRLLNALRKAKRPARVVIAGSAAELGLFL